MRKYWIEDTNLRFWGCTGLELIKVSIADALFVLTLQPIEFDSM